MKKSNLRANSLAILGHRRTTSFGMGEKILCWKLKKLLNCPVIDLMDLMEGLYDSLAQVNYALAENGETPLEDLPIAKPILQKVPASDLFLLLSVSKSLAAFLATGLHKTRPMIAKLYAHHPDEKVLTKLFEPAELIVTESLLASERAIHHGFSEKKVLLLPHHYPKVCERLKPSREYVEKLALSQKKKIDKTTLVMGLVSRLEYGKNCEFAVEAVKYLADKGENIVLVLKGDFPRTPINPEFCERFSTLLKSYQKENWLLWDRKETPFPKVLQEYTSFDVLLHPSGAEGASHIVVEALGLNKPVIVLDCTSNSYLFKDVATFVKTTDKIQKASLPFYLPYMNDLISLIQSRAWKKPDLRLVKKRFHPERCESRLIYLFERNPDKIARLYEEDLKIYGL